MREHRRPPIGVRSQDLRGTEAAELRQASRELVVGAQLRQKPQLNPKGRTTKGFIPNVLAQLRRIPRRIVVFTLIVVPIDVSDNHFITTTTCISNGTMTRPRLVFYSVRLFRPSPSDGPTWQFRRLVLSVKLSHH